MLIPWVGVLKAESLGEVFGKDLNRIVVSFSR